MTVSPSALGPITTWKIPKKKEEIHKMEFQTRSEDTGLSYYDTFSQALTAAQSDLSIWKISFQLPNGERIRLVRQHDINDGTNFVVRQMADELPKVITGEQLQTFTETGRDCECCNGPMRGHNWVLMDEFGFVLACNRQDAARVVQFGA